MIIHPGYLLMDDRYRRVKGDLKRSQPRICDICGDVWSWEFIIKDYCKGYQKDRLFGLIRFGLPHEICSECKEKE